MRASGAAVTLAMVVLLMGSGAAHAVVYTISITDQRIVPSVITATLNEKVQLRVLNNGTKTHNFILPSFYIFTPNLPAHKGTTVEFVPNKKGAYPYYSDTGGAPEPGLDGVIRIN